jgi:hypothetical protein
MPSASGLRQMLPRHTIKIFIAKNFLLRKSKPLPVKEFFAGAYGNRQELSSQL